MRTLLFAVALLPASVSESMRFLYLFALILSFAPSVVASEVEGKDSYLPNWEERSMGFTLDSNITQLLIASENVTSIAFISGLSFASAWDPTRAPSSQNGWDLLAFKAELAGSFGFEAIHHAVFVARKRTADPDWSRCELFYYNSNSPLEKLVRMSEDEMRQHLIPMHSTAEQSAPSDPEQQR